MWFINDTRKIVGYRRMSPHVRDSTTRCERYIMYRLQNLAHEVYILGL